MDEVKNFPPYLDYPKQYKAQTNADRIRAMTDDDLAEFMRSMMDCVSCYKTFSFECNGNYDHCLSVCLEWLQQPAEGE